MEKSLKHILYMDTDSINSIISQGQGELSTQGSRTTEYNSSSTVRGNLGGEIRGDIPHVNAKVSASASEEKSKGSSVTEQTEFQKYDEILNQALYILSPILCEDPDSDPGNYVKLKKAFYIVNFNTLQKGYKKDTMAFLQTFSGCNSIQCPEKLQAYLNDGHTIEEFVEQLENLCPCDIMLVSYDGYIVPLDKKFFKTSVNYLDFKYGCEMTCIGLIGNTIGKSSEPDNKDIYSYLKHMAHLALCSILPVEKEDFYVLHPIAVYYESDINLQKGETK